MTHDIPPRSGTAFRLPAGQVLTVIDPHGEQVSDLLAFAAMDHAEVLSSGRTLDYAETLFLTTGHKLYSNRSNVMLEIVADDVGRHDFLLTPCSRDTFRIIYGTADPEGGCFENFVSALAPFGIEADAIPVAFNCFMHVSLDGTSGRISVLPPLSKPGDSISLLAHMDLVVALTACSAPQSNNYAFKPIRYRIDEAIPV